MAEANTFFNEENMKVIRNKKSGKRNMGFEKQSRIRQELVRREG